MTLRIEVEIISLILIALLVYIVARRIRIPYTIALVITGIGISFAGTTYLNEIFPIGLTTDLILLVFLPGLIFEAAYHLNLNNLMQNLGLILGLAVPGLAFGPEILLAFYESRHFTQHHILEAGSTGWYRLQSVFAATRMWPRARDSNPLWSSSFTRTMLTTTRW